MRLNRQKVSSVLTREEALRIFVDAGALLSGHFVLTSGRHSDHYMQCAQVLKYPTQTQILASHLADEFRDDGIEIVIGPAIGGIIVSYEVGRQLQVPAVFAERENGKMTLRRGFRLHPNQRVLVVEDVITTGGSVREVMQLVKECGAEVRGVGVLVDRSNGSVKFGTKQRQVLSMEISSWDAAECPLCKEGRIPLQKPGSRT
ncbi:MAG: orotate phosphoribosyltransferase [Firmicutes bacterium]|jgi:orotate phosphoribosyltransferase|nr:orotate phosphoribosyltransferase [Bacillota bacterium]